MIKAEINSWKNWTDGTSYPVLTLQLAKGTPLEVEALRQLHKTVLGLGGRVAGGKVADLVDNTRLTVDLSQLMYFAAQTNYAKCKNAWVTNWLKDNIKPEWLDSKKLEGINTPKEIYYCRCGWSCTTKKKIKRHRMRCSVLKSLSLWFKRCKSTLERISKDETRKKSRHSKEIGKSKSVQRKNSKGHKISDPRTKVRWPKRDHYSKKK